MKILTVVGARPQFIKAAVVSHELRGRHQEILVHTGQHFDYNMSEQFFEELDIPHPDYNLGISGGSHAEMTGNMMIALEKVMQQEVPDWVLLYGDTNSTLAAALTAAKLHLPICHVEAGNRTHCMTNPEEINRICTDHVASLLLASVQSGMDEMKREGLSDRAQLVGNPMYDAFLEYSQKLDIAEIELTSLEGEIIHVPQTYQYMTCHREENTADDSALYEILHAMEQLDAPTVYPVHPRNKERAFRLQQKHGFQKLLLVEPVGYLESTALVQHAEKVVTDSGGLQCEAFYAKKKCVTILDFVAWPETMVGARNELSHADAAEILQRLNTPQIIDENYQPFGDGHAARKIVHALEEWPRSDRRSK